MFGGDQGEFSAHVVKTPPLKSPPTQRCRLTGDGSYHLGSLSSEICV